MNGVYTQQFNRNHVGHVYQGRYKSLLVEKDSYLFSDRNKGIAAAYHTGDYTMKQIVDEFDLTPSVLLQVAVLIGAPVTLRRGGARPAIL
ncbi:hypothetical protein [Nitrosomonas sp. HPC101]|uniref:hypothetical protein n=1 Tax=Nitrosomonas sp. HPC101 TaxID=1658667 RepID=UPI00196214E9|nr:hypothetical protein [Nitrosomonas sp. HPC101]